MAAPSHTLASDTVAQPGPLPPAQAPPPPNIGETTAAKAANAKKSAAAAAAAAGGSRLLRSQPPPNIGETAAAKAGDAEKSAAAAAAAGAAAAGGSQLLRSQPSHGDSASPTSTGASPCADGSGVVAAELPPPTSHLASSSSSIPDRLGGDETALDGAAAGPVGTSRTGSAQSGGAAASASVASAVASDGAAVAPSSRSHSVARRDASGGIAKKFGSRAPSAGRRSVDADRDEYKLWTTAPARMKFNEFTEESYAKLTRREVAIRARLERRRRSDDGRLVNGEIVFDEDDDEADFLKTDFNPKLAEGQPLPDRFGRFPRNLYGRPIEEVDHYIKYKTFVVITKSSGRNKISRYSAERALFCLAPWNPLRRAVIWLVNNQWFDYFILLVITANCVTMALDSSVIGSAQDAIEYTFLVVYTLEFILRTVARGFVLDRHTYLRDPWSYIDFGVVLISFLTIILNALNVGNQNLSVLKMLRALRVLRTLKGISIIPGLRTIVRTVFNSMTKLAEVLVLAFFIILICSLTSMQLYEGVLKQKCVNMSGFAVVNESLLDLEYYVYTNNASNWVRDESDVDWNYMLCGNESGAYHCSAASNGAVCLQVGENPNWNYTHFDDFGFAMLSVFQIFTMDHWEDLYNKLFRVKGPWTILYFFAFISIGSFYVINLILAVVRSSYSVEATEEARITAEEEAEEAARARRNENTALLFDTRKLKERLSSRRHSGATSAGGGGATEPRPEPRTSRAPLVGHAAWIAALPPEIVISDDAAVESAFPSADIDAQSTMAAANGAPESPRAAEDCRRLSVSDCARSEDGGSSPADRSTSPGALSGDGLTPNSNKAAADLLTEDISAIDERQRRYLLQKFAMLWLNRIASEDEQLIDRNCLCCGKRGCVRYHDWVKAQNVIFTVVTDGLFELFITLSILANTVVMASEHALMSEEHKIANELANKVFTWIFVIEAVLKLMCLSKEYFKSIWNVFDFTIAFFSLLDFVLSILAIPRTAQKTIRIVSRIVKIFRLLRIMKLAQSWSTLRSLLEIVFNTLSALGNVVFVLFLMMFLFAVLGSQLFGQGYYAYQYADATAGNTTLLSDYGGVIPLWNFKDFAHSILVVFRILCGSWIEMCYDCMNVNDDALCPIVFIITLLVGQFLVLNLFIALLLDAFGEENLKKRRSAKEESKLKKSLHRIYHCFRSCAQPSATSQRPDSPVTFIGEVSASDRTSLRSSSPSVRRGSTPSIPRRDSQRKLNGNAGPPQNHRSDGRLQLAMQPIFSNGTAKSKSHQGPTQTVVGQTQKHDAVHATHGKCVAQVLTVDGTARSSDGDIPGVDLLRAEQAFDTNRDQYSVFEHSVVASHLASIAIFNGPTITAEDYSADPDNRKTIVLHAASKVEKVGDDDREMSESDSDNERVQADESKDVIDEYAIKMRHIEEQAKRAEDGEVELTSTGEVVVPDCCFAGCNAKCSYCYTACPPTWTKFRMACIKISTNVVFEYVILAVIFLSSLSLCFEDIYLDDQPTLDLALQIANYCFTGIFVVEMVLKLFGIGPKKYMTSFWTVLDGAIVLISMADIIADILGVSQASAFKSLRCLRGIRPLRAASRWEGMKIVINALAFALPAISHVFMVCLLFWLIFAILGVQLFAGRFYACYDPANPRNVIINNQSWQQNVHHNVMDMTSCLEQNFTWRNMPVNFDNVMNAYVALYQVATFEGWIELMQAAVTMPDEVGQQPQYEKNMVYYVYFVGFVFIGSFFSLNFFIGVIIDNFNMLKKQYDGSYVSTLLTETQRHYYNTLKRLSNKKPQKTIRRPKEKVLAFFFDIVSHKVFEYIVMAVIFGNVIVMILDNPSSESEFRTVVKKLNTAFTGLFFIEAIMKLLGYRMHYFRRMWNVFDFIIVIVSVAVEVYAYVDSAFDFPITPTMLRILRVFRVGRVLRLIKAMKGIRKLLSTLLSSLPGLINIGVLLLLFMFIFSIVFMSLFLRVRINQPVFGALTETVNFQTFANSFCLLFRLITVAGWNDVLNSLMVQPPYCNGTHYRAVNGAWTEGPWGECGHTIVAPILMIVYLFLMNMIIVNMYIAVILESYENANEQERIGIDDDDVDMFYNVWERFDPLATQYIPVTDLSELMDSLEPPLRVPKPNGTAAVVFNLPITEGERLHCLDVLMALVKRTLHTIEEADPSLTDEQRNANEKLKQQIAAKYKATFPARLTATVISTTMQRKKEDVAARTLQGAWRRHRMQRNIARIRELALEQSQREAVAAEEEDARSIRRRLSSAFGSARSRISSAVRRLSRAGSVRSSRHSVDTSSLHVDTDHDAVREQAIP